MTVNRTYVQRGVSLVEMMIALFLGMIIVSSALALYANSFGTNGAALRIARLNNELRSVLTSITRDLRRAGYSGSASGGATSSATAFNTITVTGTDQIVFSYDLDSDGTLDANESFGYRQNGSAIQVTTNGGANWENITDPDRITITGFEITDNSTSAVSMGATPNIVSVQTRSYTITISGSITSSGQTYTRVLQEDVRVRNEGVS